MKVFISCTEYAIVIELEEAHLWEWLTCLEEQYALTGSMKSTNNLEAKE